MNHADGYPAVGIFATPSRPRRFGCLKRSVRSPKTGQGSHEGANAFPHRRGQSSILERCLIEGYLTA